MKQHKSNFLVNTGKLDKVIFNLHFNAGFQCILEEFSSNWSIAKFLSDQESIIFICNSYQWTLENVSCHEAEQDWEMENILIFNINQGTGKQHFSSLFILCVLRITLHTLIYKQSCYEVHMWKPKQTILGLQGENVKSFASGLRKKNHNHNSPRKVMVGEFNSDSICENKTKRFLTRRFENWIFTRKLRLPCLLFTLKRNILYLLYLLPFHHIKYLKIEYTEHTLAPLHNRGGLLTSLLPFKRSNSLKTIHVVFFRKSLM